MKRRFVFLWLLAILAALPVQAAKPRLTQAPGLELSDTYQTGKTYNLVLNFSDADGDRPRKAQFIDQSGAGTVPKDAKVIGSGDPRTGVPLTWEIRGFDQGAHRGYFLVTSSDGNTARYPENPEAFYTFKVENVVTKWIILGVGVLVGLLFVPFLTYVLTRSLNKRSDPSKAARVGLLIGILACAALFIYLFESVYGPLAIAIGALAGIALLIVVLTRR